MRQHNVQIGDLISLEGSVYGSSKGVVIDHVDPDVRIMYTAEDGTLHRIRRRADSLVVLQKKQNENV